MPSAPAFEIDPDATFEVTFATDKGDIVATVDASLAPPTVNHFVVQARNGFYDGLTFHRVVPGFVIQGGTPQTVVVRARGPSLVPFGIANALMDPVLQLFTGQTQIGVNDD